jgi:hypothetical protein
LECEHFVDCVRTGVEPRTDALQGLAVVSVLEAAGESLRQAGRRVPVTFPMQQPPAASSRDRTQVAPGKWILAPAS